MRGLGVSVALTAALLTGCAADRDVGSAEDVVTDDPRPVEDDVSGFRWTIRGVSGEARPPTKPFGSVDPSTLQWLVDSEHRPGSQDLAVVGAFASADEATKALGKVRRRLPAGTGRYAGSAEAVVRLGPLVVARGLRARWQATAAEQLLADVGASGVLVEDRASSPGFLVDVSCQPTRISESAELARDLIDFGLSIAPNLRPPWVEPRLTDEERLARSTLLRAHRGRLELMQSDPVVEAVADAYLASVRNQPQAEEQARKRLDLLLADQVPSDLEEPYDERVLAAYRRVVEEGTTDIQSMVARKVEPMLGQLAVSRSPGRTFPTDEGAFDAGALHGARLDERLDIAGFEADAFVPGLARLVMRLDRVGCEDVRIALIPQ